MQLTEKDFKINNNTIQAIENMEISATAPSNIALIKYWGKHGLQLPMNPSLSFTLNQSKTITKAKLTALKTPGKKVIFTFYLNDQHQPDFEPKIAAFFDKIQPYVPFINRFEWRFYSQNSFPHSSGIASSASGFAALAKIIMSLEKELFPNYQPAYEPALKTSFLARLGSGSAARSITHPVMIWGQHPKLSNTSDLYAVKPNFKIHPVFHHFKDSIVLVEKGQKKVSSSVGHQLMADHPFKTIRKQQAFDRTLKMMQYLQTGDIDNFIKLTEAEALGLHALMMTSDPNYILMQPDTLKIIHLIRNLRSKMNLPVCFTLDAGANVHVLYPEDIQKEVQQMLFENLPFEIIHDYISQ